MNKYIPLLCIPLLLLFGCSTTPDQARNRADNAASRRLEKRIDDLSDTISLLVNDGNRLHNDLAEVKALTRDIQLKTEGLATSIRDLEERMEEFAASVKDQDAAPLPYSDGNAATERSPLADFNELPEKVISDVQQVVSNDEVRTAVDEQTKAPALEDTSAVQTGSAGIEKKEDIRKEAKEAVRLVVDNTQKTPAENKTAEATITKQDLAAHNTAEAQEEARNSEEVAKTEAKGIAAAPAVAPVIQEAVVVAKVTSAVESTQKGSETAKQVSGQKADVAPPKQDAAVANLLSDPRTREPYLKEAISRLAEKVFPDNKGAQWNIISFDHKAHLTHTEAEPLQADLGYPRFKFVVSFKTPENPNIIGTYSFSGGQYTPYFPKKK